MKLLIIGYGKMGKTIEGIAKKRGHEIADIIDVNNYDKLIAMDAAKVDAAIEFTQPEAAFSNLKTCLQKGIPVISGTTGWLEKKQEIETLCREKDGTFFYASNFSIGVNIFFRLNKYLAGIMNGFPEYDVRIEEIHHKEKKDAPSGTAITLAESVIENVKRKTAWVKETSDAPSKLAIASKRESQVPGTHTVNYYSLTDDIEIRHTAHSREGFALGAVLVAEWLSGQKGVLTMDDYLKI